MAEEMGILTVGVLTKSAAGWATSKRTHNADVGLAELQPNVNSLIVRPLNTFFFLMLGGEDLT